MDGHGLQSRIFAFSWRSDGLEIEYRLPYARILADEEDQSLDDARIGAAIRLAILLLASFADGSPLHEGEATLSVTADESGSRYSIIGFNGEELDSGEDWEPLVARLGAALQEGGVDINIIWP